MDLEIHDLHRSAIALDILKIKIASQVLITTTSIILISIELTRVFDILIT